MTAVSKDSVLDVLPELDVTDAVYGRLDDDAADEFVAVIFSTRSAILFCSMSIDFIAVSKSENRSLTFDVSLISGNEVDEGSFQSGIFVVILLILFLFLFFEILIFFPFGASMLDFALGDFDCNAVPICLRKIFLLRQ